MLRVILKHELDHILSSRFFWLSLLILIMLNGLAFIGSAGFFDAPSSGLVRWVNSPFEWSYTIQYLNKLVLFLIPALVGHAIYRDYPQNAYSIIYSFPIKGSNVYFGKFLAGIIAVVVISVGVIFVPIIAVQIPGLDPAKLGPHRWLSLVKAFALYSLPILLFSSALVFLVVSVTRNSVNGFIVILGLFLIQVLIENMPVDGFVKSILDPFGQTALMYMTSNWTLTEKNVNDFPLENVLWVGRLILLIMSAVIMFVGSRLFSLSYYPLDLFLGVKKGNGRSPSTLSLVMGQYQKRGVQLSDDLHHHLKTIWFKSNLNVQYIFRHNVFLILCAIGLLSLVFVILRVTQNADMVSLPVTHLLVTFPAFFFGLTVMVTTFIVSGLLVHRAKTVDMDQLQDAAAVPSLVFFLSKLFSIWVVQIIMLALMMVAGIGVQIYHNYYEFEVGLYLFHLLLVIFPGLALWAVVSLAAHHFANNLYLGIGALILLWVGISALDQIGLDAVFIQFNHEEPLRYSQINGYGEQLFSFYMVKLYWLIITTLVGMFTAWTWRRGSVSLTAQLKSAWRSGFYQKGIVVLSLIIISGFLGYYLYEQSKLTFEYQFKGGNKTLAVCKENIRPFVPAHNVTIIAVDLNVDIYPEDRRFKIIGDYSLLNDTDVEIDTMVIRTGFEESTELALSDAELLYEDDKMKWSVYKLSEALPPGGRMNFSFEIESRENVLFQRNSPVIANGTLIKSDVLPRFGIQGLHPEVMVQEGVEVDHVHHHYHYQGGDAGLVDFKCKISTSRDQTPFTVGNKVTEELVGDRRMAEYITTEKIKFGFAFMSGRYEKLSREYNGVVINSYHIPEHAGQVSNMIDGIIAALDFNEKNLVEYGHDEINMVEFPNSEGSYSTVFGNIFPTSEVRYIANNAKDKIDLGFYVPAHEITHYWWGGKVMPAAGPGALMLTESLTEYFTYQIYEKQYGADRALDFIEAQHRRYLQGRTRIAGDEPTLMRVGADDAYISYGKGAIAFRSLAHYIGNHRVMSVLNSFMKNYPSEMRQYPRTDDLVCMLYDEAPDSLKYIVEEYFETVTFHDVQVKDVSRVGDTVSMELKFDKLIDGELSPQGSWVDIGFYQVDSLVASQQIFLETGTSKYKIPISNAFNSVIVDPQYYLVDKNRKDNKYKLVKY